MAIGVPLIVLLASDPAYAWGPAAHLQFGISVLGQLDSLNNFLRQLLSTQPMAFLYGCVSADVVLAKKLGRARTHSHMWENALRLVDETDRRRIKAFALGYASHLAADTISHNCFVPGKIIESYDSGIFKHMYWELLFDRKVSTHGTVTLIKEIADGNFDDCDAYFERRIPMRLFDFSLNKKIFNRLLVLQGLGQWQKLMGNLTKRSPWSLDEREIHTYSDRSVQAILSFLKHYRASEYIHADPVGRNRLKWANALRKHYRKRLTRNDAPSVAEVRRAVHRFAHEPFERIEIRE